VSTLSNVGRPAKNILGDKIGLLTVLKRCGSTDKGASLWKCLCDCGNIIMRDSGYLSVVENRSCGCYLKSKYDITGQKFNRLTAIRLDYIGGRCKEYWLCKCDCGVEKSVRKDSLKNGGAQSCGCIIPSKVEVNCSQCGKKLERRPSEVHDIMYCSPECKSKWQSENNKGENSHRYKGGKITKTCLSCGVEFKVWIKDIDQKYCSSKCYGIYLSTLIGEDSPSWKNAQYYQKQRKSIEYKEWRIKVLTRYEHTCQKCGTDNAWIQAHHIKPYAGYKELRLDVDNGIALCKKCHDYFHSNYGKVNIGEAELSHFLAEDQVEINCTK